MKSMQTLNHELQKNLIIIVNSSKGQRNDPCSLIGNALLQEYGPLGYVTTIKSALELEKKIPQEMKGGVYFIDCFSEVIEEEVENISNISSFDLTRVAVTVNMLLKNGVKSIFINSLDPFSAKIPPRRVLLFALDVIRKCRSKKAKLVFFSRNITRDPVMQKLVSSADALIEL